MNTLVEERPVAVAEPAQVLERVGPVVTLPEVQNSHMSGLFSVSGVEPVPFSEICKAFRKLLPSQSSAPSIAVSARRLTGGWTDEEVIAALRSAGSSPYVALIHVYEYLKHAERRPADLETDRRPHWYLFYYRTDHSDPKKREDWVIRALWDEGGWSMSAGRTDAERSWDEDEEILVIAPDS